MKALFELGSGISLDSGSANNTSKLFDRSSIVGLSTECRTVTRGRQTTPLYEMALVLHPMAIPNRYSMFLSDSILAGRADNAVKYRGTLVGGPHRQCTASAVPIIAGSVNFITDMSFGAE